MATPGKITNVVLTPGVASLPTTYTNPTPGDTDRVYYQIRATGDIQWVTVDLPIADDPGYNSGFEPWNLASLTSYDVRARAINDADGFGPWSDIVSQTTLADTFGPPLVSYDEDGVVGSGPGTQLTAVNNTNGSLGSNYNLDTTFGMTSNLTEQVRNGRRVWQLGGSSQAGLSTSPTPPSPAVNQPCTIYVALVPFFVDGNHRWLIRGGFSNIEIRAANFGWIFTSNGNGNYNVGTPMTDGRLYVLEFQVNNTNSKARVMDDQGNDTGEVTFDIQYGGSISPESMFWDVPATAGHELPAQVMEMAMYQGVGSASERQARREELFQKFAFDAPNLIEYTTGDASNLTGDSDSNAGGSIAILGATAQVLEDIDGAASGSVTLGGETNATLSNCVASATGTVETPPPPPIVPPRSPSFQRMYEHLLPAGEAFKLQ